MQVKIKDIEKILGFKLNTQIKNLFKNYNLKYDFLTKKQYNNYIVDVINVLINPITISGEHRLVEWENGWNENFKNFLTSKNIFDLIPKYHSKRKYVRWLGKIINPEDIRFDYNIHTILVDSIITHYLKDCSTIFEFGCGPGYHLIRLNNLMPNKTYWGADWATASQNIIKEINCNMDTNFQAVNFNFFEPNRSFSFPKDCGVYTVAALEQTGKNFEEFIKYILEVKPKICVHLEPIDELLNDKNLLDFLSIKYFRKRNYLNGFLPYLEKLEKLGKIKIIKKQRIFTGSYFIEGHSLIVWQPL